MAYKRRKAMKKIKAFFADFKKFISRGNILDMAVGVIIGGAFSTIVTSLTNKIIMPLINLIVYACTGGTGISLITVLNGQPYLLEDGKINPSCLFIDWGSFIIAVINFLIIAFVLFLILKAVMKANDLLKTTVDDLNNKELLKEKHAVRVQAKAEKKSFKLAWKEHLEEKAKIAEEKAKLEAEEKAKKEEEERLANPSQEELLKQILIELKKQNECKK